MRDFYTKENMQEAVFHVLDAGLVFEPARLAFEMETGTGREGVIRVRHRAGKPARGYVYPSGHCMRGVREQFAPAADGTGYIRWQFDARGLAPGQTVRGLFRVISPYGEYGIPYAVEISGRGQLLKKKPALRTDDRQGIAAAADRPGNSSAAAPGSAAGPESTESGGEGSAAPDSKEAFLQLAAEDFARAAAFFYSARMEEILTSDEDRTLYRGLSMQEGNLQNVEEFLVAACGKEKVIFEPVDKELFLQTRIEAGRAEGRMAGSRAERALEAHRQRVRNSGMAPEPVRREKAPGEDLVYVSLRIRQTGGSAVGPVIRTEGRFLPADPFFVPADSGTPVPQKEEQTEQTEQPEQVYTVRIPVNRAALHAGKNLGRVIVQGPFNEFEVPVEVRCSGNTVEMRRRQGKELEFLELQLMRMYVDFRLEYAGRLPDGWLDRADRLIDEISMRSHRDLIPRLYGVHLLILRGQNAEARRALGRIALRYAGTDEAQNLSARFTKEPEEAYSYRQYLQARCREEDPQLRGRVVRYLRGLYRQTGSWRTAWMLLDLSEEYAPGTAARWNFLRHQFESGCNSPLIWIEAWDMVRADPQILLPGSSIQERWARDDFGLHVLWYAARNRVLTPKAAEVMMALAEKKKTWSPLLYRGLCDAYEMYREPETVDGTDPGENAGAVASAAAGDGPEDENGAMPDAGRTSPMHTEILRAICMLLVRGQDLSPQAHRWYSKGREAGIQLTRLEENWRQSMPEDDSEYRLPAGRNAILRTTAKRAVRAVLVYDRFRGEEPYPIRGGIAFLPVYGNANTIFLEDGEGNRYAKSLPYVLDVQEEADRPASVGLQQADRVRPGRSLNDLREAAASGPDPHALAEEIGFGERGEIRLLDQTAELADEQIRGAGMLLDSGLLTSPARTSLLLACLRAAQGQPEAQQYFLTKADPAQCSAGERGDLYAYLADAGSWEQALRWLTVYGSAGMDPGLLGRLCEGIPWEGNAALVLQDAAWDAFSRGNRDAGLMEKLSASFPGLSKELLQLRKACADAALPTAELDRRILRQVLFSGAVEQDHARVLTDTGKKTGPLLMPAAAQFADHAFTNGLPLGLRMTELLADLINGELAGKGPAPGDPGRKAGSSGGRTGSAGTGPDRNAGSGDRDQEDAADVCRIACLKELSMRQGDISQRERTAAKAALSALLSKGIVFPFFRQFPGYDDRLDLYAEETLVQYHPAEPDDGSGRKIVFHYTTSRRGEAGNYRARPMKEMYRDFYVSGFLLFYGEQMRYYITDDAAEKHVVQSGTIGQDARILEACSGRFGLINDTTKAAALREYDEALSLLTGYYRRSYLESELFRR